MTIYDKLDKLVELAKDIREDILNKQIKEPDEVDMFYNMHLQAWSTWVLNDYQINELRKELLRYDQETNQN